MNKPTLMLLLPFAASLAACGKADAPDTSLVDVAQAAARETDRVSVEDLARWIIEDRRDFELVDVRGAPRRRGDRGEAFDVPSSQLRVLPFSVVFHFSHRLISNSQTTGKRQA